MKQLQLDEDLRQELTFETLAGDPAAAAARIQLKQLMRAHGLPDALATDGIGMALRGEAEQLRARLEAMFKR